MGQPKHGCCTIGRISDQAFWHDPEAFLDPFNHGLGDGTPRKPGDFSGVAPDKDDPPLFESEPCYLSRLGLLTDDERDKLTPGDFEPIPLSGEYWPT